MVIHSLLGFFLSACTMLKHYGPLMTMGGLLHPIIGQVFCKGLELDSLLLPAYLKHFKV
jgi:hypothetical protein